MLYSRYARREEESIRRAFRLLKVRDTTVAQRLIARAKPGSRLQRYAKASSEAGFSAGLADALLHPCVRTFRIDDVIDLIGQSGLELQFFAHTGALADNGLELTRLRRLEVEKESPGNFVFYLGHKTDGPCSEIEQSVVMLNPCLRESVRGVQFGTTRIAARLGQDNPPLGRRQRAFLRRFMRPVPWTDLSAEERATAAVYLQALFLLQYRR
jgi:hypothetical protein